MKTELVIALDIPSSDSLSDLLTHLPEEVKWFKVGMELFTAEGPAIIRELTKKNKRVFLDLKYHDIPNTAARAVKSAAGQGVSMLTVHACGGRAMLIAAAEAARGCGQQTPKLIAVTTLTSLDKSDLAEIGIARTVNEQALALADMALSCGVDGVVTSAHEAASLRNRLGDSAILVTPGIRPASKTEDDQKRAATPVMAVKAGSNFLVVGRPILNAPDPRAATEVILEEMRTTT